MYTERACVRVLIAEDDPAIIEDYLQALGRGRRPQDFEQSALDSLEADLFSDGLASAAKNQTRFDIVVCHQGEKALEEHASVSEAHESFDVALIDVRMPPGIDGVETARRLREADPGILIGIVTGYSDLDFEEIAKRILPQDKLFFIRKPFLCREMRAIVVDRVAEADLAAQHA